MHLDCIIPDFLPSSVVGIVQRTSVICHIDSHTESNKSVSMICYLFKDIFLRKVSISLAALHTGILKSSAFSMCDEKKGIYQMFLHFKEKGKVGLDDSYLSFNW